MASPDRGVTLETSGICFAYGERTVLDRVDIRAEPGEIVGVVGPNGSGKSTLVKLLCGVLEGYRGSAKVDGREVSDLSRRELARMLAVVPQEQSFGFAFTALEIVLMGRHPHLAGLAFEAEDDQTLARACLDRCDAGHLADRPVQELSSGERQRVVFARTLAQQPRGLLLDEPASFLDIRHQVEIYDLARELVRDGKCSVLTVLHDLNLAAEYCDRVYLLREGAVAAGGPTDEVFTYANLKRVFDTDVYVDTNSLTGKLLVVPLPGRIQQRLGSE